MYISTSSLVRYLPVLSNSYRKHAFFLVLALHYSVLHMYQSGKLLSSFETRMCLDVAKGIVN